MAGRLLVTKKTPAEMYVFCQRVLETYVILCVQIYGLHFMSYNVHCLLYLVQDVEILGVLESFSAFDYENNMPQFLKLIRKPDASLQQYYKRTRELNDLSLMPLNNNVRMHPALQHIEGPLPENFFENECQQYKNLEIEKIKFFNKFTRQLLYSSK